VAEETGTGLLRRCKSEGYQRLEQQPQPMSICKEIPENVEKTVNAISVKLRFLLWKRLIGRQRFA
jgi:hypothetical protein